MCVCDQADGERAGRGDRLPGCLSVLLLPLYLMPSPGPASPFKEVPCSILWGLLDLPGGYGNACLGRGFSTEMLTAVSVTHSLPSRAPDKPDLKQSALTSSRSCQTRKSPRGTCPSSDSWFYSAWTLSPFETPVGGNEMSFGWLG